METSVKFEVLDGKLLIEGEEFSVSELMEVLAKRLVVENKSTTWHYNSFFPKLLSKEGEIIYEERFGD